MKVGILTFHRAINYGAVLQCYSLYHTLVKLNCDVEIVDYRPWFVERYRRNFVLKEFMESPSLLSKFRYIANRFLSMRNRRKASEVFSFFLRNFNFSPEVYSKNDIYGRYDIIFYGSDQIWNPTICRGFDDFYWGKGDLKSKKCAYAASIGETRSFEKETWNTISLLLQNFDEIAVREESFCTQLKEMLKISSTWVLDPSLLSSNVFDQLLVKPKEDNYIFLFTVQKEEKEVQTAKLFAEQMGCKIIQARAIKSFRKADYHNGIEYMDSISPGEFCGYIKHATLVLTNSFHATAFSVNYNKDFYIMKNGAQERMNSLVNKLMLSDRIITPGEFVEFKSIDYSKANSKLMEMREQSMLYIKKCLDINK